jgi:hypothetical protein
MDDKTFKELADRLKKASAVVEKLDPVIREDAWSILRPFVGPNASNAVPNSAPDEDKGPSPLPSDASEDALIEEFESEKEAENLYLTLAILYKRHGKGPFSLDLIRSVGKSLHLPLPTRPDTTLRNSTRKVVRKQEGGYKIQPGGETWLKKTYGVTKGKQPIPTSS